MLDEKQLLALAHKCARECGINRDECNECKWKGKCPEACDMNPKSVNNWEILLEILIRKMEERNSKPLVVKAQIIRDRLELEESDDRH